MNLLAGTLYDPAVAVSKATTAAIALTALDTTNLRLAFTVPASGRVRVRMCGTVHGATTAPQLMLGVLEGATVKGRVSPMFGAANLAATSLTKVEADFIVTGLTPGASLSWDAAYGVETVVAATGLKYGGPNNTTVNDAFGGFAFEIYDPSPITALQADLPIRPTKNTALSAFPFKMVQSSDHITPATGLTITAQRSLDGAAFANCANQASEIGSGWYKINLAASDLNGDTVALKFSASGADQRDIAIITAPT